MVAHLNQVHAMHNGPLGCRMTENSRAATNRQSGAVMNVTKIVWLPLMLCALMVRPAFAAAAPVSVQIAAQQDQLEVGDNIMLDVTITNTADRMITLELINDACDNVLDVRDESDTGVPDTPLMRQMGCSSTGYAITGRDMLIFLKPTESYKFEISVSQLKAISWPGKYTIQLSRALSQNDKETIVKSNKITISVTQ